jgi:NAD(P)-dependent dehydrogenase (short-subunit alcohol dehydrogenase family)
VFLCCKHGIPHLLDNRPPGGSVINMRTFLAQMGAATAQMAYSSARASNALCMGPVDTPALRTLFADNPAEVARRNVHIPMGRFGRVEEIAGTVAYLAGPDAGFITAAAFPVHGGIASAYTIAQHRRRLSPQAVALRRHAPARSAQDI